MGRFPWWCWSSSKAAKNVSVAEIRNSLFYAEFSGASVQTIGDSADNEVLIKVQAKEGELNKVEAMLKKSLVKTLVPKV